MAGWFVDAFDSILVHGCTSVVGCKAYERAMHLVHTYGVRKANVGQGV